MLSSVNNNDNLNSSAVTPPTAPSLSPATLLKQREAELHEANLKLQERDQLLSRINQEMYKKNLELIQEKRQAEALLYNITEAVIVTNKDGTILLFNRAAQDLIQVSEREVLGNNIDTVLHIFNAKEVRIQNSLIKSTLESNPGIKLSDLVLKGSNGREKYVSLNVSKVEIEANNPFYVAIISDLTEEIKAEKAREEFISIASHELRTPMTIIKNYLWMLQTKKGGNLSEKQEEYLNKAVQGTERMIKLIHDMLDISKMEQGKFELRIEAINIQELLEEIASDFKIKASQKGIVFDISNADNITLVYADTERLREVIVNLVANSFKFTETGSIIVKLEKEGELVRISVMDTGKGIAKDDLVKLFHKFGRLDNSFVTVAESGGTGLGLYIVKSIIEAMGGRVGVESAGLGQGTVFWFTIKAA